MKYIKLCHWAFVILYKEKTISRMDRFRLWKKSLNQFVCFLAFTDKKRPVQQLEGAMVSAVLSAIYDYETDWVRIKDINNSIYLKLLKQYAFLSLAYERARQLFISDWKGELSEHGLERGSIALVFYDSLIKSEWMSKYRYWEIAKYGRLLQIIDDLLDLKEDIENDDTNCFRIDDNSQYLLEAKAFLLDDFFKALKKRSVVYHLLEFECKKVINQQENIYPTRREKIHLLRPFTGLFSFVFTIIGFRFFSLPLSPAVLTGLIFAGITWSTMVWNDLVDRERDVKKGKTLASRHPYLVHKIWWQINKVTLLLLIVCAVLSWKLSLTCFGIWYLSTAYSVIKPKYPFNNLLVAFCSGSPVLVGMVYAQSFNWKVVFVFLVIFSTIAVMELVKDIQDMEGDVGYKDTLPIKSSKFVAIVVAMFLSCIPIITTIFYPSKATVWSSFFFIPIVWSLAYSIKLKQAIYWTEKWGDLFIASFLITILITQ